VLGVVWWTVMRQVIDHGTPEIDASDRLAPDGRPVTAVGGRRDRVPARHRDPRHDVRDRDRRFDPRTTGPAVRGRAGSLRHRAGRVDR
jgi:hypothetical protein